jgi:hypothetical protein
MAMNSQLPNFSFQENRVPKSVRVTQYVTVAAGLLFLTPLKYLITIFLEIALVTVATRPLRAGHGFWIQLLIIVSFVVVVYELLAFFILRLVKSSLATKYLVGEPRFDELKGPGTRQLRLILGCIATLVYDFKSEDERVIRAIGQRDYLGIEQMYRHRFLQHGWSEQDWPQIWEQMGAVKEFDVAYGESILTGRWSIFANRHNIMLGLTLPLASIYTAGSAWLLAQVAQGSSPLRLIQFALLTGFVIAALIFANFTTSLRAVKIVGDDYLPPGAQEAVESLRKEGFDPYRTNQDIDAQYPDLKEIIRPRIGQELYPQMEVQPGYVNHVRGLFSRYFLLHGVMTVALLILCLGAQWPLALAFSSWTDDRVNDWTIRMLEGVPLIPLALMGSLTLGFYVISRFKKLWSLLVTAVILAMIPLLITYVFKGSPDKAALLSAVITAVIGALSDAVAQLVKEKPGVTSSASLRSA